MTEKSTTGCAFCDLVRAQCGPDTVLNVFCGQCQCLVDFTDLRVVEKNHPDQCNHHDFTDQSNDCDVCDLMCDWLQALPSNAVRLRDMCVAYLRAPADLIDILCPGTVDICMAGAIAGFSPTDCYLIGSGQWSPCAEVNNYTDCNDRIWISERIDCSDDAKPGCQTQSTSAQFQFNIHSDSGLLLYQRYLSVYLQAKQEFSAQNLLLCLSLLFEVNEGIRIIGKSNHQLFVSIGRRLTFFEASLIPVSERVLPLPIGVSIQFVY